MRDVNNIRLLVFDLDGTIFESHKATFEVLKRAFVDLHIDIPLSEESVKSLMGEPTHEFFSALLGPVHAHYWEEIMEKYDAMIPEFGEAFPGVPETLSILKDRGYTLALCSNCARDYLDGVLHKTGTTRFFDYAECFGDNQLAKSQLVRKIVKERFTGLESAVIGDRIHDIEAAKANNAVSVGVLYGYGKGEARNADITVARFSDLLSIFKERSSGER